MNIKENKEDRSGLLLKGLPWLPVAAVMALIFCLSSIPGRDVPHLFSFQDIPAHAMIYALLGFFFSRALKSSCAGMSRCRRMVLAVVFCLLYGLSDEFHQLFIIGRTAAFSDIMVDAAGGLIGSLVKR